MAEYFACCQCGASLIAGTIGAERICPKCGAAVVDSPSTGAPNGLQDPIETPLSVESKDARPSMAHEAPAENGSTADESIARAAPPLSESAIWYEVLAVLAVGVIPGIAQAIASRYNASEWPTVQDPYWLKALNLTVYNVCISFVVLYLIYRSGEPWSAFGLARLNLRDFLFSPVIFLFALATLGLSILFLPTDSGVATVRPKIAIEWVLAVISNLANGFSEELVTRAYLITRLEYLLQSRARAVVLSALCFASYHTYYGGPTIVYIAMLGIVFGGLYLLIRRVWPFALAHAIYDLMLEFARY